VVGSAGAKSPNEAGASWRPHASSKALLAEKKSVPGCEAGDAAVVEAGAGVGAWAGAATAGEEAGAATCGAAGEGATVDKGEERG